MFPGFFNTAAGRTQIDRVSRQIIGMSNVNAEELRDLLIPLPPLDIQRAMVEEMRTARTEQLRKLAAADDLVESMDVWLLSTLGIIKWPENRHRVFAVRLEDIEGALNPERYSGLALERLITGKTRILNVGSVLNSKVSPSRVAPNDLWDRIRIDDLPNNPLDVEQVQTQLGKEIEGSFFQVQRNDILLARLGPTIQNAKFVLCPETQRRTVASSEFLVLRCNANWTPEAVLAFLRTRLFRDLMYSKSRGATPSRYRLNAEDFATLPFPAMSLDLQNKIAKQAKRRRHEARLLREQAETDWEIAKRHFEEQLLAGEAV